MTIELTEAQRQALQADHGSPVDVVDPATREHYVLLAREQYERVQPFLNSRALGESGRLHREPGNEIPAVSSATKVYGYAITETNASGLAVTNI